MKFRLFIPNQSNKAFLHFWEMQFEDGEIPASQYIPPFGHPELIFFVNSSWCIEQANLEHNLIKGQYICTQEIKLRPNSHLFGIRLHPYGLSQFFSFEVKRINNSALSGNNFKLLNDIQELINQNRSINIDLLSQLNEYLNSAIIKNPHPATIQFLNELIVRPSASLREIYSEVGFSSRTLQRNFTGDIGLNPKLFHRITRINKIELAMEDSNDFIEVLTRFNLVDQSHLNKEFKQFRTESPSKLISKKLLLSQQLPQPEIIRFDL